MGSNGISNAQFLKWMNPILTALKELGGSGTPKEVRDIIAKNENLSDDEISETRGKNNVNKFSNEVAFARNYLVFAGYIDKSKYGIWKLTDLGLNSTITDVEASKIFREGMASMRENIKNESLYNWIDFYIEFATVLLTYKNNRKDLIKKIKAIFEITGIKMPKLEINNELEDMDPFSVFALFNKGIKIDNKIKILSAIANLFEIKASVPDNFDGIPVVNPLSATFYWFKDGRGADDINNLWNLFEYALKYSENDSEVNKNGFIEYYDKAIKQRGVNWNITMGLYWIRPYDYINLDSTNRTFISDTQLFAPLFDNMRVVPNGELYLYWCKQAKTALENNAYEYSSFPEFSHNAWKKSQKIVVSPNETSYWIFSPGPKACMWDAFVNEGIMAIDWKELGCSITDFSSKEEIKSLLKRANGEDYSYKNDVLCIWQFANEIQVGDIVFAKKGMNEIIGKGIVVSDYVYDDTRQSYCHIRKVDWQKVGYWKIDDKSPVKTLTNITPYSDYVRKLLELVSDDEEVKEKEETYDKYTKEDFLNDVFIEERSYDTLVGLLDRKNNIILQGAPGVGKTFAAKRLAFSIMGEKDTSRISMVQFHQSYSYEDFIQGYRPTENGFKLESGTFYKFCKLAEEDDERPYFFIIDEINRGNLSKIFGELMMLIESDKRGEKLKLLYNDEWFTIPKNVRIIGMMNTADRSLAMMDYALRRRFAFFEFEPAFESSGFVSYLEGNLNDKFNKLIGEVKELNSCICDDESLGKGFRIGHSYFCTDKEITDEWLDSVVEYEIIPLLNEYWFDEPSKVVEWTEKLRSAIK